MKLLKEWMDMELGDTKSLVNGNELHRVPSGWVMETWIDRDMSTSAALCVIPEPKEEMIEVKEPEWFTRLSKRYCDER